MQLRLLGAIHQQRRMWRCVRCHKIAAIYAFKSFFFQTLAIATLAATLSACNSVKIAPSSSELLQDSFFQTPVTKINPDNVFALSQEMRIYLRKNQIKSNISRVGLKQGLYEMISKSNAIHIEYDAEMTRNASQTFASHSGNCLSLVIMTTAFAKELGLDVQFQSVIQDRSWSQSDNLIFAAGHVNVSLSKKTQPGIRSFDKNNQLIIDFLPSEDLQNQKTIPIEENTILAMYMNNRAAELLSQNNIDDAYWYARQAIDEDPAFLSAYNTLGVIYRRHDNLAQAELAFREILKYDNKNLMAISNLAETLQKEGKTHESKILLTTLHELQPVAPFHYFELGKQALQNGKPREAINLIKKEMQRDPYYHEFHLWLALSYMKIGNMSEAKEELLQARTNSITRTSFDFYTGKMERLNASLTNSH